MPKDWKKEVARDLIALGSIPFYLIVIIRAIIGEHAIFVYQMLIALIVLTGLGFVVKADVYVARSFVICVFTSLFYNHSLFTIFAFILWVLLLVSAYCMDVKRNVIIKGIILGIVSSGIAYYLVALIPAY